MNLRCSTTDIAGGGGSDVEVCGYAFNSDGSPASGATVRIRPESYVTLPASAAKQAREIADAVTDQHGRFVIGTIGPGTYRIEVNHILARQAALLDRTLDVESDGNLGDVTLSPWAAVIGRVESQSSSTKPQYVQVYGLERLAQVDSAGRYVFTDLPTAIFNLRIVSEDTASHAPLQVDSVTTRPGDTTVVPSVGWRFLARVRMNTSSSGANIAEDVVDFPILVRLDSLVFDFSQAMRSGADICFTTANGLPLPHEVELWDSLAGRALIWVRIDTVFGDNADQYVLMQWGNNQAGDRSNSAAVFDTAAGYAGVWHMRNPETGMALDATATAAHGIGAGIRFADGPLGKALLFDSTSNPIDCGNPQALSASDTMTVSAWVALADTAADRYMRILSKKTQLFALEGYELECNAYLSSRTQPEKGTVTLLAADTSWARGYVTFTGGWHLLSVCIAGDSSWVFCNGREITTRTNRPYTSLAASAAPLLIGGASFGDLFHGMIDELRIEKRARRDAYIRLCYENQKYDQVFIRIERPFGG